jgi:hypothetical protein
MNTTLETQVTIYSVRLSRRTSRGTVEELAATRVSLAPTASAAAIEAVAVRQAARKGVPVHLVTERQAFRLCGYDPATGAECWTPVSRSGSNAAGFDGEE